MRPLIVSLLLLIMPATMPAWGVTPPADLIEAMELCDRLDLHPVEGLWSYPDDDVTVMILRDEGKPSHYGIYVVEAADCALSPRDRLGDLEPSTDPSKFGLTLFTRVAKGVLSGPCKATAKLSEANEAITVTKPSLKFSLRTYRILPSFWRMVSINVKNPPEISRGMIRVYPSYDGNGSLKRHPRYL